MWSYTPPTVATDCKSVVAIRNLFSNKHLQPVRFDPVNELAPRDHDLLNGWDLLVFVGG